MLEKTFKQVLREMAISLAQLHAQIILWKYIHRPETVKRAAWAVQFDRSMDISGQA